MSDTIECKACSGTGIVNASGSNLVAPCVVCFGSGCVPLPLSPWRPMTDANALKHLGKLSEELGELQAAIARCIIQGIDECEPVTKKPNRQWLLEEIADVYANLYLVHEKFGFSMDSISSRAVTKINHLKRWHAMGEP